MYLMGAKLSKCEKYRYVIWRRWENHRPLLLFVCLNPSTADAYSDDKTMTRCVNFARDLGYGAVAVVNLFAVRATKVKDMKAHPSPIGPLNDKYILKYAEKADKIICAWGVDGIYKGRDRGVGYLLRDYELNCLALTKESHPRHPLYLRGDSQPQPFQVRV